MGTPEGPSFGVRTPEGRPSGVRTLEGPSFWHSTTRRTVFLVSEHHKDRSAVRTPEGRSSWSSNTRRATLLMLERYCDQCGPKKRRRNLTPTTQHLAALRRRRRRPTKALGVPKCQVGAMMWKGLAQRLVRARHPWPWVADTAQSWHYAMTATTAVWSLVSATVNGQPWTAATDQGHVLGKTRRLQH